MEHSTSDAAALMVRCASRDVDAMAELYDRTCGPVYRLCLYVVGTRAAAEEAAAETYSAAWREANTFASQGLSLDAWLLTITRRAARAVAAAQDGAG